MAIASPLPNIRPAGSEPKRRAVAWCLGLLWFVVLVVNLPAFLCMGLDPDVSQWDLCTRTVQQGGTLYRDAVENNLPGILWFHLLIRSVLGWRPEMLRMVDLLVMITVIWQLIQWLSATAGTFARLSLALTLLVFYLSTSEWVHCQRDVWMLLPALLALALRRRQVQRLSEEEPSFRAIISPAAAEGFIWGIAFWIKPFVAVPALVCWLLSARQVRQGASVGMGKVLRDGLGVIAGGLLAGVMGCTWLAASGAWPSFVEIVFVWNRQYLGYRLTGDGGCVSFEGMWQRLSPWIFVHIVALPEALVQITRPSQRRPSALQSSSAEGTTRTLLAGLYLGWLLQALVLQHSFDYVHVPPILLGLTLFAGRIAKATTVLIRPLALAGVLMCILAGFPLLCLCRLRVWSDCVRQGSTPQLRDSLILTPKGVRWSDLERVKVFLKEQGLRDGELNCTHMDMVTLFTELDVKPATRFHFLYSPVRVFKLQRDAIYGELAASRLRFIVCDAEGYGIEPLALPAALGSAGPFALSAYPWLDRIVFRSGRYVVFRLSGAETPAWLEATYKL